MTQLLVLKEHLQQFYRKYALFLHPAFHFFIGFLTFYSLNRIIGYNPVLNHGWVEILLAMLNMVMPGGMLLFLAAAFTVMHIFYVSSTLALVVGVILGVFYFAYAKFVPEHAYIILAFPIAFSLHIAYALPILLGIIATPVALVPIACGVGIYYLLQNVVYVISTSNDSSINLYHAVLEQFIDNKEMYATFFIFAIVMLVVYIIRNREWNYAFDISILVGSIMNMVLFLIVNYLLDISMSMPVFFVGILISSVIVWIIQFMRLSLNYTAVENLQFEDEEYYYYVRAVPKMNVSVPKRKVKRISARHFTEHSQGKDAFSKESIREDLKAEQKDKEMLKEDFEFKVSIDEWEDPKKEN